MGIGRAARSGRGIARGCRLPPPERSHAISNLFLPPEASKALGIDLPADKRRLSGVRLMESANPEAEAQAIALLIRASGGGAGKARRAGHARSRACARGWSQHLRRWNIEADDTAGRAADADTTAGRLVLQLAELAAGARCAGRR